MILDTLALTPVASLASSTGIIASEKVHIVGTLI